jgi:hypothetical protein
MKAPFRLRVTHPRYPVETRRIEVTAGRTAEVRIRLTPRGTGSAPVVETTRVVNEGVGAVKRFFRGLGL